MIATHPFGRTGHMSTRTLFGAASLGKVTQDEADRTLKVLDAASRFQAAPSEADMASAVKKSDITPLFI